MKSLKMVDVLSSMCNLCFSGNRNCAKEPITLPAVDITSQELFGLSATLGALFPGF